MSGEQAGTKKQRSVYFGCCCGCGCCWCCWCWVHKFAPNTNTDLPNNRMPAILHTLTHTQSRAHTHTRNHTKMQGFWARPPSTSRFAGHTHKHRHTHTFLLPRKSRPLTPDRSGDRRQAALHTCVFFGGGARASDRGKPSRGKDGALGGKRFAYFGHNFYRKCER